MPKNLTRRSFLSYLLASAATASLIPKYAFSFASSDINPGGSWLSFSSQKGIGSSQGEFSLLQNHCALHKETVLPRNRISNSDYRNTVSHLKTVLANKGIPWVNSNRVLWTYQHYGVCDTSIHTLRLLSYSRSAQDYLYDNVSGLMGINLDWNLLIKDHGRSFVDKKGYKGFVGKHTYLVYRVNAVNEEGEQILPGIVNIMPVERAINYIVDDNNHNPIGSTIFLIHGRTSLISPFSELIHLTTHQPTLRLTRELAAFTEAGDAQIVGREFGESITEAAGCLLALSFLQKYGRPDEKNVVRAVSQNISNQYPLVENVMTYMNQNSVQHVLNDYSENPRKVIKAITKVIAVS